MSRGSPKAALPLKSSRRYHGIMQTKPTGAQPIGTASVQRNVALPGGVTMNLSVTAEALVDGTVGDGTTFTWEFDSRPMPCPETEDGAFFVAWEAALGEALNAVLQATR